MTAVGDTEPDGAGLLDASDDAVAPVELAGADGLIEAAAPVEPVGPGVARTRDVVLALGQPRPAYRPELGAELRQRLEDGLAPVVARLAGEDTLTISKHDLATVFDCERRFLVDDDFVPSVATVRGTVTHRALARLVLEGRSATPMDAADAAVDAMAQRNDWYSDFLRELPPDERAELVADVGNLLTAFVADWPPVQRAWQPRLEFSLRVALCGGRVRLVGRPDMALGRPIGGAARVVLVDFKTGWVRAEHREDLRFYALLETLVRGAPPFRCATYYPEMGDHSWEDVTEDVLATAVRRVVDGADRIEALRARRRTAVESPGSACTFCGDRFGCEPGQAHLAARRAELDEDGLVSEPD
jgi:RecB family exonuclease